MTRGQGGEFISEGTPYGIIILISLQLINKKKIQFRSSFYVYKITSLCV